MRRAAYQRGRLPRPATDLPDAALTPDRTEASRDGLRPRAAPCYVVLMANVTRIIDHALPATFPLIVTAILCGSAWLLNLMTAAK